MARWLAPVSLGRLVHAGIASPVLGTHLMTHPAKTSRTPSMPPLPCTPPDTPVLPQMGAIGRRMVALNWTNSELSSAGVEEVRRRDEVDAVGGAMVVRVGWEDSLGVLGSF